MDKYMDRWMYTNSPHTAPEVRRYVADMTIDSGDVDPSG